MSNAWMSWLGWLGLLCMSETRMQSALNNVESWLGSHDNNGT